MSEQHQCTDCFISFDSPQALTKHKQKFCINSGYADLDSLTKQYDELKINHTVHKTQIRPPSKHFNLDISQQHQLLNPNPISNSGDLDKEYRQLLRQIGDREDMRNRLEQERFSAEQELMVLEKKEKELFLNARRNELQDIIKKRQQLIKEEDQLQKEIKQFQKERKEESRIKQLNTDDDYAFREGREAGKLAMQRRLLEEKKRDIEANLKAKRREEEKIYNDLNKIKDQPIFIPQYRKKESPVDKNQYQIRQTLPNSYPSPKINAKPQTPIAPPPPQNRPILQESALKPLIPSSSKKSVVTEVDDQYLKAALFSGKQKTLFESLNPKGKSDQDIFIESLVAQEYDALNILARIPKDSQLYAVKMKQFQEMSRIRQELKDKIQKVRLDKVRREFQMQKNMTETEKANIQWLDKNRKNMLNREVEILQNQVRMQQLQSQQIGSIDPNLPPDTPGLLHKQSSQGPALSRHPTIPPQIPSIDNISQTRLHSQHESRGYTITVKSVRGYSNRIPMCVKVVVLEQNSQNGHWVFNTKYHDVTAPKDDRNPYNPGVRNRLDQSGSVIFNQTFEIRQDLQNRYNNNQSDLYLWLMLMQKDQAKLSNEPQLYSWYCFKLTHFGHIREGSFTLALYHDNFPFPDAPDMNRMKAKAEEEILIDLAESTLVEQRKPKPQPQPQEFNNTRTRTGRTGMRQPQVSSNSIRNPSKYQTGRGKTIKLQPSEPKLNSLHNINEQFFIENDQPSEFQEIKNSQKISFNFSIGGLRTLPSYIGPLKLQVRFLDCQNDQIVQKDQLLTEFGNDMYNPMVNYVKKIKIKEIPSSAVVLIRLIGISTLTYEPGLVGFAYLHLCFDSEGAALENDQADYYLINGHYQLPIYWGNNDRFISLSQLHTNFPPIPCSSILVSIDREAENPRYPPDYSEGVYNTVFFQVDESDYRLFRQQSKRQRLKTLQYVQGYYKFKGVKIAEYKEQDLRKLLSQALAFNSENTSNLFMLQAMAEYSSSFGIKVCVDSIQLPSNQTNYYYFVTMCLYPPARYYSQDKNDLQFLYRFDLSSSLTSTLVFNSSPLQFDPPYDPNTAIILELHRIKLSDGSPNSSVQTCGFTVLALFDLTISVPAVNVGYKDIMFLQGQFDKRQLASLQKNCVRYVELMQGQKKSEFGVIVRILNGYFGRQLAALSSGGKGKPLRSIFQNSKGFKSAEQTAKKIIEDSFGVSLS